MKVGVSIIPSSLNEDLKIVERLISQGIRMIAISDYYKAANPFVLLQNLNENFKGLILGTAVTNLLIREPNFLADFFNSQLVKDSNSFFLGIGAGDWSLLKIKNLTPREAIQLLSKGLVYIKNRLKRDVKIYVGAQGIKTLSMIEVVDGLIINLASVKDIQVALNYLGERKNKEVYVIAQTFVGNESIEFARKSAVIIYAGLGNSSIELYGFEKTKRDLLRTLIEKGEIQKARRLLSVDDVKRVTICGTVEEVRERISEIFDLGIDGFIIGMPMGKEKYQTLENIHLLL
ncbi:MAG TPA: hypothetical protein VKU94_02580 [Geobacterales bacterium]|nr:hypothetical protein [Geobacterales bacterium]